MTDKFALIGNEAPDEESLAAMMHNPLTSGGARWAAYQNHALDSREIGHLRFIAIGEDCTFKEPPSRHPDTNDVIGWKYVWVGWVDLETGLIVPKEAEVGPPPDTTRP